MAVATQVSILFLLIVVGFIVKKMGIVSDHINDEIGQLIMKVTLPAFIIVSMNYEFSYKALIESFQLIVMSFVIYLGVIILSFLLVKLLKVKKHQTMDVYQYALTFSNVGYMGYPVVSLVYGSEGVFYAALYNLSFNLLVWTYGIYLMTRHQNKHVEITVMQRIKHILNPGIVAVIIGFTLFLTSFHLPVPIYETLKMIGNTTTPLSMMFIGFLLSEVKFQALFETWKDYVVILVILLVFPLLVYLSLNFLGYSSYMLGIPVLIVAMPAAANAAIFASLYDNDAILASKLVFISTLLSVVTVPLFMVLL